MSVDDEFSLIAALREQPRPAMPQTVRERLDAAIAEESSRRSEPVRRSRWNVWLAGGAAAALAVIAGTAALTNPGPTPVAGVASDSDPTPMSAASPDVLSDSCGFGTSTLAGLASVQVNTGATYSAASLRDQTKALLTQDGCAFDSGSATAQGDVASLATAERSARRCVWTAAQGRPVRLIDSGWYDERAVVVTVIDLPPTTALVLDCTATPAAVLQDVALN